MSSNKFRTKWVLLLLALAVMAGGNSASGAVIGTGFDYFQTLPGGAELDVGPFVLGIVGSSIVSFEGLPIGPGMTDTIIQRHSGLAAGAIGLISAEIIELSLISVSPLMIDHGFGAGPEAHDVFVNLTPLPNIDPGEHDNTGWVNVTSHHEGPDPPNAGFFDSSFDLNATVTLVAAGHTDPPMEINTETLDSIGASFSHNAPPDYPLPSTAGNFFSGAIVHEGPHPVTFPAVVEGQPRPDDLLPPLCTPEFPGYSTTASVLVDAHTRWAANPNQMVIDLQPGARHCPVDVIQVGPLVDPTGLIVGEYEVFDSTLVGAINVTLPQGEGKPDIVLGPFDINLQGPVETSVFGRTDQNRTGTFDTEIVSMSLTSIEPIFVPELRQEISIVVRQSPTRRTLGRTIVTETRGVEVAMSTLPVLDIAYRSDPADQVVLPDGSIIKGYSHTVIQALSFEDTAEGLKEYLTTELDGIIIDPRFPDIESPFHMVGEMVTLARDRSSTSSGAGSWDVEILSMDLSSTDPNAPLLQFRAGQVYDLPSTGQMRVTSISEWDDVGNKLVNVDSFFDITYQISVDGEDQGTYVSRMELGGTQDFRIDSFFDVFTELSLDGGQTFMPMLGDQGSRMTLGGGHVPGDTDDDGDVDVDDILRAVGSFEGPQVYTQAEIQNKYRENGDTDGDRDVDVDDIINQVLGFSGASKAGDITDHAGHIDLIYNLVTGNVQIDSSDLPGINIMGYQLKNAAGGLDFIPASHSGEAETSFGGVTDNIVTQHGWANPFGGFDDGDGLIDLGNIFPTGFATPAALAAWLTQADYTSGTLGATSTGTLDLRVVPEPGTLTLLAMSLLGLVGFVWRRRASSTK